MLLKDAMAMINKSSKGYAVAFEWVRGGGHAMDYFPDTHPSYGNEPGIETEEEAWDLAFKFAAANKGSVRDVHVISADTFKRVDTCGRNTP